ncbi:hypothetical protein SMAC4_13657 [Sordaria macrospora]|uniref:uncharacterized protein n=1 Tax=Sordaria macrospora TaxID=5147 RepID=UPI002B2F96B5|nr:hypothetical protein SMAC4_13657 [Sordaria macrospora]
MCTPCPRWQPRRHPVQDQDNPANVDAGTSTTRACVSNILGLVRASARWIGWFGPRILGAMESGQLEIPRFSKAQHCYPVYRIPLYPLLVIPQM